MKKGQWVRLITKQMNNLKDLSTGILQTILQKIVVTCPLTIHLCQQKEFQIMRWEKMRKRYELA